MAVKTLHKYTQAVTVPTQLVLSAVKTLHKYTQAVALEQARLVASAIARTFAVRHPVLKGKRLKQRYAPN